MTVEQETKSNVWEVMISSRMRNFEAERRAAEQAIIDVGMKPLVVENPKWPNLSPSELCQKMAEECDLLLLILGPSYGFQPDGQPAGKELSATHMEYMWAQAKSKRKILVFVQEGADSTSDDRQQDFIAEAIHFSKGRVCKFFKDGHDLARQVVEALNQWKTNNALSIHRYLGEVRAKYEHFLNPVTGSEIETVETIQLRLRLDLTFSAQGGTFKVNAPSEGECSAYLSTLSTFAIIGTPGSGKSTLLKRQVFELAKSSLDVSQTTARTLAIPFYVTAVELARNLNVVRLARNPSAEEPTDLRVALRKSLGEAFPAIADLSMDTVWDNGQAVVIVDGLDELGGLAERALVTGMLRDHIGKNRAVLASRPASYQISALPKWLVTEVQPLPEKEQDALIRSVLGQLPQFRDAGDLEPQVNELRRQLKLRDALRAWSGNPLLLTLVASVYATYGGIPEVWAKIYRFATEALIDPPYRQANYRSRRLEQDRLGILLESIAINLTEQSKISASTEELRQFTKNPSFEPTDAELRELTDRAALLQTTGPDRWAFVHLTFQEYFTAVALSRISRATLVDTLNRHRFSARWEQPIQLLVSELDRIGKAADADAIVSKIAQFDSELIMPFNRSDPLHLSLSRAARCQGVRVAAAQQPGQHLAKQWFDLWRRNQTNEYIRVVAQDALALLRDDVSIIHPEIEQALRTGRVDVQTNALWLVEALLPYSMNFAPLVDELTHHPNQSIQQIAGKVAERIRAIKPNEVPLSINTPAEEPIGSEMPEARQVKGKASPLRDVTDTLNPSVVASRIRTASRIGLAGIYAVLLGSIPLLVINIMQRFSLPMPHVTLPMAGQITEYAVSFAALLWFFFASLKYDAIAVATDDIRSRTAEALVAIGTQALPVVPTLLKILHNPGQSKYHLSMSRTLAALLANVDDVNSLGQVSISTTTAIELPESLVIAPPRQHRLPNFQLSWAALTILVVVFLQALVTLLVNSIFPQLNLVLLLFSGPATILMTGTLLILPLLLFARNRRRDEPVTIQERDNVSVQSTRETGIAGGAGTVQRNIEAVDPRTGRRTVIASDEYTFEEVPDDQ